MAKLTHTQRARRCSHLSIAIRLSNPSTQGELVGFWSIVNGNGVTFDSSVRVELDYQTTTKGV